MSQSFHLFAQDLSTPHQFLLARKGCVFFECRMVTCYMFQMLMNCTCLNFTCRVATCFNAHESDELFLAKQKERFFLQRSSI